MTPLPLPLPLIAPNPPRLSELTDDLRRVETSGIFSNNGPEARAFEAEATARLFAGRGACLTVANATVGLMIALADATRGRRGADGRWGAIMPAMTFAATAQAAWWAGLTPIVCDVDPNDWCAAAHEEERLLARHGAGVAALVPYAAFGRAIDLERYAWLAARHDVAVVVDAAASLGTYDADGIGFGAGASFPVVYSMHATKPFAVAEGGLIHCADAATIERLRAFGNFGFTAPRTATLAGLNAKLPEVIATMARAELRTFDGAMARRHVVLDAYRDAIGARYQLQAPAPGRQAHGFLPVLLPRGVNRARVLAALTTAGVGAGTYFDPHLGAQPWVREVAEIAPTPVADDLAARIVSLPITEAMDAADARRAVDALDRAVAQATRPAVPARAATPDEVLLIGGGPAGTALLTAASKAGVLPRLAAGLTIVEQGPALGAGRLGGYAITSDSSAATFLTSVTDNPHPEIARLVDHPAARRLAQHRSGVGSGVGVPLTEVGPLLDATGVALSGIVTTHGGRVLTGQRVTGLARDGTAWRVTLNDMASGATSERRARRVVIATGGHQPLDRVAALQVAGAPLAELAGGRLVQSDAVLAVGGTALVGDLVAAARAPRIAVVGGSTSALTAVAALLKSGIPLGAGAITLLHRRPLRPFYPSVEAAQAEGFTDFGADDICPVSGFVYRLAGFRLEARELVLRMLGIDGRSPDPRVALHRIAGDNDAPARAVVRGADVVVAALGYRPRAIPVAGVTLAADVGASMVDRHCRVLDASGVPLPELYGIGLAAGFLPWGRLGGEASFRGQANGLWLWQNDVGRMIVDQLLGQAPADLAREAA